MEMVFVTGDTHGDWKSRLNRYVFPEGVELTKDDYVIVGGDFGIWDDSPREHANLDWLENKKFTTLFVAGNHSNYDILDNLPVEEWHGGKVNFIRPSVIHLMRGQIFDINDRSFFTFGGASCHDIPDGVLEPDDERIESWYKMRKMFRINHLSWWERELPSEEEMEEGLKNLAAHDHKVDYIITHSPCSSILEQMDGYPDFYAKDYLTDYLDEIKNTTEFEAWMFGHMHVNVSFEEEKCHCIFDEIGRLE